MSAPEPVVVVARWQTTNEAYGDAPVMRREQRMNRHGTRSDPVEPACHHAEQSSGNG